MMRWVPTRKAGLERLTSFLPNAGLEYQNARNFDYGPVDRSNISCLSPWIRHGLVTEEEVIRSALSQHSFKAADKFIQEVFWRSYFKGWLEHHPDVWDDYCKSVAHLNAQLSLNSNHKEAYDNAINGHTGIDCFDAWIGELKDTGYLHNHARMWFASIWIFTLKLPWQLGADFFYQHLMDADAASNTCSWRWVAGLHTKGKNYIARADNIEKFTKGRFAPIGLALDAEPITETQIYARQTIEMPIYLGSDDPLGILITEEDCSANLVELYNTHSSVLVLTDPSLDSSSQIQSRKLDFKRGAINHAFEQAKKQSRCDVQLLATDDWAAALIEFAESAQVKTIVTSRTPVGETRDRLKAAQTMLEKSGIELKQLPSAFESACLPYTKAGFFKLKSKIPVILNELGWTGE